MEISNEYFTKASAVIQELQLQFTSLDELMITKDYSNVTRRIEEHFDELSRVMNQRKMALLREAQDNYDQQLLLIHKSKVQLDDVIKGCKIALRMGEMTLASNPSAASRIWKELSDMPTFPLIVRKLVIDVPTSLRDIIETHGKVDVAVRSADVETANESSDQELEYPPMDCSEEKRNSGVQQDTPRQSNALNNHKRAYWSSGKELVMNTNENPHKKLKTAIVDLADTNLENKQPSLEDTSSAHVDAMIDYSEWRTN